MNHFLATKDLNSGDPLGGLGERKPRPDEVKAAAPPPPAAPIRPGSTIYRSADGKLETRDPKNKAAKWPRSDKGPLDRYTDYIAGAEKNLGELAAEMLRMYEKGQTRPVGRIKYPAVVIKAVERELTQRQGKSRLDLEFKQALEAKPCFYEPEGSKSKLAEILGVGRTIHLKPEAALRETRTFRPAYDDEVSCPPFNIWADPKDI